MLHGLWARRCYELAGQVLGENVEGREAGLQAPTQKLSHDICWEAWGSAWLSSVAQLITPNVNIQEDNPCSTVSYCEHPSVLNYWKYYFCLCENPQEFQFKKQPSLTTAHHGPTATDCAAPEGLLTSSSWRYPDCGSWCSDSGGDGELCLLLCASALEAVLVTAGVASSQLSLAFYLVK